MLEPNVLATLHLVNAHLLGKGHDTKLTIDDDSAELACGGVRFRAVATAGIAITAANANGFIVVISALADLETEDPGQRAVLTDIRYKLGRLDVPPHRPNKFRLDVGDCLDGLDPFDVCDLLDVIELASGCDLGCL